MIRALVAAGTRVAAIKHTHHVPTEESRGDTASFLREGAMPVILAGAREAVLFGPAPQRISFDSPLELLQHCATDVVLVEGFKNFDGWTRVDAASRPSVTDVLALLDRIG